MHNHNDKKDSSMLWMMLLCIPLLVILLLAGGKLFSAGYLWPILIGVFVVAHFWMMFRGHSDNSEHDGHNSEAENKETPPAAANDTHNEHKKHGGCCN